MKTIIVLFALAAFANAAALDGESKAPKVVAPDSLFEKAWSHQKLFTDLQDDINEYLTKLRTAVSVVLKDSTVETLHQIQDNAVHILELEDPARISIYDQPNSDTSECYKHLKILLNAATEFTGYGSSNCASAYDQSVQAQLASAYTELRKLEAEFGNVQQVVVKSFSRLNVFTEPASIENNFTARYTESSAAWARTKGDVDGFINKLKTDIAALNARLGSCFTTLQNSAVPAFVALEGEIKTCDTFEHTADPFAVFRL
jgi:hypothetical protein